MINLVLKTGLIDNQEPDITKVETSKQNFGARFIYELQPWKFRPYMKLNSKAKAKKPAKQDE